MLDNRTKRGARIVVVDPRRTETGDEADLFLGIEPGTDTALFCGLLVHLADSDALDHAYIDRHTSGFEAALERARRIAPTVAATAERTGLEEADVAAFFEMFRASEKAVTCYSQGVNQSAQGTDKVNAVINCHLATGRIGRPGMGPFSLTGQPNAMGGREVGGMANMLAAHMGFSPDEVGRVGRFWNAPRVVTTEGLKAVAMFDAVAEGRIKALWIMATNPAVSLPRADHVRAALQKLDLLIVSENVLSNDTVARGADILLPAAAWGEKDGTVTNSERRISRQRPFLRSPGEAKPDWWIVTGVAQRMGFGDAFPYETPADIFREHAALSAFENGGSRDFDLGGVAGLSTADYETLEPLQWPVAPRPSKREKGTEKRFFAEGGFFTPDQRARFVAPEPPAAPALPEAFPFRLNTGRTRDQWHTMTRTGLSARLGSHAPVPVVDVNPEDAARLGLRSGDLARMSSAYGSAVLEVAVTDGQRRGSLFAPIHWSEETSSDGRVGALVQPVVDVFSGQPDAKGTPAAIERLPIARRGFVLSRTAVSLPKGLWWARVTLEGGAGTLFATDLSIGAIAAWATTAFPGAELAEYADPAADIYRIAAYAEGQLVGCVFVGPAEARPQWEAVKATFAAGSVDEGARRAILSGMGLDERAKAGPTICACFGVGLAAIRDAVLSGAATNPEAIGTALRAGTNCGSCVPELRRIIARELAPQPG
jgi:assimilatory nitrate reductase catalytic subunit